MSMQDKPLDIERVDDAGGTSVTFRLHGPLMLGNFFSFQSMVRNDNSNLLIVDVADVPFIDSAGIGCLVGAHVSRENAGRKLVIVGATERLFNSLKATKVAQLFTFADTVEDARAKVDLRSETTVINFNIGLARKAAWFIAQRLANEPSFLHEVTIDGLDLAVSVGGRAILYPPCEAHTLATIRAVEVEDVRKVIDILAQSDSPSTASGTAS